MRFNHGNNDSHKARSGKLSKILVAGLCLMLLLALLPTVALATSETQDGIEASLVADKSTYDVGDTVNMAVRVTNTNNFAVSNVKIELTLPSGLKLKAGETSIEIANLGAGETKEFSLAATISGTGDLPQTGEDSNIFIWIGLSCASLGALIILLLLVNKKYKTLKLFPFFFCFIFALLAMLPAVPALAASTRESFSLSETVKVDGNSKTITAKVSYDWEDTISVTSVTVAPETANLIVGGTQQLTATVAPDNATNKAVTWESSDTGIATVSDSGLVTAKSAGITTITVKTADGDKSATCVVTVTAPITATGISLDRTTITNFDCDSSQTRQLTATVAPSNATNQTVTWDSSDTAVATVDGNGLVTAVGTGTTTITATTQDGNHAATCAVTVGSLSASNSEAAKITGFTAGTNDTNNLVLNPTITSGSLAVGATLQLVSTNIALGGSMETNGTLSLNTANVVDAADLSTVNVSFTVTLNGVTSAPVTPIDISSLLGATTTADKLRTDKAKIPTNGSVIGTYTFIMGTTNLNTYYSLTSAVTLSSGVAFAPVTGYIIGGGNPGINADQLSLKADAGGNIQIAFVAAPTIDFNCRWQITDIILTCEGTSYTRTGVDFLVIIIIN